MELGAAALASELLRHELRAGVPSVLELDRRIDGDEGSERRWHPLLQLLDRIHAVLSAAAGLAAAYSRATDSRVNTMNVNAASSVPSGTCKQLKPATIIEKVLWRCLRRKRPDSRFSVPATASQRPIASNNQRRGSISGATP